LVYSLGSGRVASRSVRCAHGPLASRNRRRCGARAHAGGGVADTVRPVVVSDIDQATPIEGGPAIASRNVAAASWALFCGLALIMVGNGLNGAVLGLRSEAEGFGLGVSGLVMASYFAGFLAGTSFTERALRAVGHIRVFAALASTASSAVLVHTVIVDPIVWSLMRFVFGACMAGLYVVVESWLNDLSTNATRARLLAVYMVVSMGSLGVGQLMLNVADPSGFSLFVLASVLVSMALVPVTLSASSAPPLVVPEPMNLRALVRVVPSGVFSSFCVGAALGTLLALGAVYGSAVGMSPARISVFLAAPMVASVLSQWPIGLAADRFPRRAVMIAVAVVAAAAAASLLVMPDGSNGAIVAMFVVGAAGYPLYSLTIAYSMDWLPQEQMMGASAALVRINGVGSLVGPLVTAGLMAAFSPHMYFVMLCGAHALIAVFLGYRALVRDALPMERQRRYVAFPARATAAAAALARRSRVGAAGPGPAAPAESASARRRD
jgi:MFS family permease